MQHTYIFCILSLLKKKYDRNKEVREIFNWCFLHIAIMCGKGENLIHLLSSKYLEMIEKRFNSALQCHSIRAYLLFLVSLGVLFYLFWISTLKDLENEKDRNVKVGEMCNWRFPHIPTCAEKGEILILKLLVCDDWHIESYVKLAATHLLCFWMERRNLLFPFSKGLNE